jgi:hypothetical protein
MRVVDLVRHLTAIMFFLPVCSIVVMYLLYSFVIIFILFNKVVTTGMIFSSKKKKKKGNVNVNILYRTNEMK